MKILKSYMALAAGTVLLMASCSEGQYWTEPADMGQVVAFTKPAASISLQPTETAPSSYTVTLSRSINQGDLNVPVTLAVDESYADVLTGPTSVSFADGSYTADYTINIGTIEPGNTYKAVLSVTQPDANALVHPDSQNLSFSFSISQVLSWSRVTDHAIYYDYIIADMYGVSSLAGYPLEVSVDKCDNFDGLYRILNPYTEFAAIGLAVQNGGYIEVDARDPNRVYVPLSPTGVLDGGTDAMELESLASYFLERGNPADALPAIYWGSFKDNVITINAFNGAASNASFVCYFGGVGPYLSDSDFVLDLAPSAKMPAKVAKRELPKNISLFKSVAAPLNAYDIKK